MATGFTVMDALNKNSKAGIRETPKARFRTRDISIFKMYRNEMNFYSIEAIEELAGDILTFGLKQNLELVYEPCEKGEYRIVAGERRWLALKYLVSKGYKEFEMATSKLTTPQDNDEEQVEIIIANAYRNKSVADMLEEEKRLKESLEKMKAAGKQIKGYDLTSGRLRDVISSMLHMSKTKVAQIESVNNNLIPEFKEELKGGRLTFSAAYELSGMPEQEQKEALGRFKESGELAHKDIKSMKGEKAGKQDAQNDTGEGAETATDGQIGAEPKSTPETENAENRANTERQEGNDEHPAAGDEYQTPHPEGITSLCYSCTEYETCNVKTGTCTKCDQYKNRAEAYKTNRQRYSEEQDRIDRETARKLRERADEERMNNIPSASGEDRTGAGFMAAGNIKGITIEIGGETTKLDKALKGVNDTSKTLQNQLKAVNQALKLDPGNTELLAQKQKLLTESIEATKEKLLTLKEAQEQAAAAFARGEMDENQYRALQTEIIKTESELKNLESQLEKNKSAFERAGTAIQAAGDKISSAGEKITKLGDGVESAGKKLLPATTAITGIGTASVAAAVDFEDAIAKLSTIADTSEKTGVPIEKLEQQIKDLSDQTGISASEIADNVYNAISAGQDTGDAVNFVAQSTKLAAAGFAESGASLDLLTTILNAYGMEASEVNHVSDVLINTQNKGKTTVAELSAAMGKIIPTANASNVSLEQLAAGYSIMTANGIATAETTTYMNGMLNELSKNGTAASDTIKNKTGKSFQELMEDGSSLADVLEILQEQAAEDGVAMNDMFGSAEAGKAALTLLSGGVDEFNASVEEMKNGVKGATDEAFGKLDTTSRQAKIALNEVKNAGIDLGQTILQMVMPYFQQFTQKIKDATIYFRNLDDSQKQMIIRIAAIVAAIGPALMVGGKVISTVGKVMSGIGGIITKVGGLVSKLGGLPSVLSAIASPVGIVIAAIAALAAGFIYLYNTSDEFREKVNQTVEKVKQAFSGMVEKVRPLLEKLKDAFQKLASTLIAEFQKLMKGLQPVFEFILTYIGAVVNGIMNAAAPIIAAVTNVVEFITNIVQAFVALFEGDTDKFFSYIQAALQNAIDFVQNVIMAWVAYIVGFFEGFGIDIKKIFSDIWNGIVSIFQGVGQWFSDRFTEAYTNVTNVFKGIGQWFGDRWTDIKNALSTVGTWFLTMFQNAYTNVTNVFKGIGQWFGARWTDIKNALSTVASWFLTMFQNSYNNIVNVYKGIGQWFAARWTDIKNALSNVADWFRQKFQAAYDNVTSIFQNIGSWFQTNVIDKIKSVFDNFSLLDAGKKMINSLVDGIKSIHLPKLSITWGSESKEGDGGSKISIPVPHISWNALGGIMKNPTIFGMYGGKLQGGGEAGDEAILPLDIFYKRTENYIDNAIARAMAVARGAGDGSRRGGDFIQNIKIESPEPLSPYEVARQTRNQTRNMVLRLQRG